MRSDADLAARYPWYPQMRERIRIVTQAIMRGEKIPEINALFFCADCRFATDTQRGLSSHRALMHPAEWQREVRGCQNP